MNKFKLKLDDMFLEDLYFKLESISEGVDSHEIVINASDKRQAAKLICFSLERFLENNLKEV